MANEKHIIRAEEDTEISIKDILAFCFLHWRSAIVICLIAGLLVGGYKGFSTYQTSLTAPETTASVKKSGISNSLGQLKSSIDNNLLYTEKSDFMKIDPTRESRSEVTMIINTSSTNSSRIQALKSAYTSQLKNGEYLKDACKNLDLNSKYVSDLISIASNESGKLDFSSNDNQGANTSAHFDLSDDSSLSLTIRVIGSDKKTTEGLLDAITKEANNLNKTLSEEVFSHDLNFVAKNTTTIYDKETSETQVAKLQKLLERKATYKDYTTKFQEEVNSENATLVNPTPQIAKKASVKVFVKWFAIGAFVTFLLYGFVLCLVYVMSSTPLTKEQFESRFNFFILGEFSGGKASFYKKNAAFDKWLRKIMGMKKSSEEDVYNLISANLNVYEKDAKSFLIIGSAKDKLETIVNKLQSQKPDCKFAYVTDITKNPESRIELDKYDEVIFTAEYGESSYEVIAEEVTLVNKCDKKIAGVVMM